MKKLSVSMTPYEQIGATFYLILQLFAIPVLLQQINGLLPSPLSDTRLQFVLFLLNFLCISLICHKFLLSNGKTAFKEPLRCIGFAALGFGIYYGANLLLWELTYTFIPDYINENNDSIALMIREDPVIMFIGIVLLVPVAEETLFRGLIFRNLYQKNPWLGYLLSATLFSLIHIIGYIGSYDLPAFAMSFLLYLPAGLCLSWAYVQSDTILSPILIHATVNLIAIFTTR